MSNELAAQEWVQKTYGYVDIRMYYAFLAGIAHANKWRVIASGDVPDNDRRIIVTDGVAQIIGWYQYGSFGFDSDGWENSEVTHWRELNELPTT